MAAVAYYLFMDRRESDAAMVEVNKAIKAWSESKTPQASMAYQAPFRKIYFTAPVTGFVSAGGVQGVPPSEMLAFLKNAQWAYPATVMYREEQDDRWSWVVLGMSSPEFGGEDS